MAAVEYHVQPAVEKFSGEGFHGWKTIMKMQLIAKDLWNVTEGAEAKPKDVDAAVKWENKNARALATITLGLSKELMHLISGEATAQDAWTKLVGIYEGKNNANQHYLRKKFFRFTMDSSANVAAHVSTLKELWGQLAQAGVKIEDSEAASVLLASIPSPSPFDNTVSMLEAKDVITFDEVVTALLKAETIKNERKDEDSGPSSAKVFFTNTSKDKPNWKYKGPAMSEDEKKKIRKCFLCQKSGHYIRECTELKRLQSMLPEKANIASSRLF